MSEALRHIDHDQEHQPHSPEAETPKHGVSVEHEAHRQHEILAQAEQEIDKLAKSKDEVKVETGNHRNEQPLYVNHELKSLALNRTLSRVRRQLSSPNRLLSKVIHQPAVQSISEATAKTVARPTGLLTGSLVALVGSSLALYLARHYGFSYNYLLIFVLFIGGYVAGFVVDLVVWLWRRRSISG